MSNKQERKEEGKQYEANKTEPSTRKIKMV